MLRYKSCVDLICRRRIAAGGLRMLNWTFIGSGRLEEACKRLRLLDLYLWRLLLVVNLGAS